MLTLDPINSIDKFVRSVTDVSRRPITSYLTVVPSVLFRNTESGAVPLPGFVDHVPEPDSLNGRSIVVPKFALITASTDYVTELGSCVNEKRELSGLI